MTDSGSSGSRPVDPTPAKTAGKGRPTPKRSEKERRRGGPVPPPPQTRKEAAKRVREQQAAKRNATREGTARGDDRTFMPRDAGPVRKLVRDTVDSRRNIGVLLLPLAVVLVLAQVSGNRVVLDIALALWLAGVLALIVDVFITGAAIRRNVKAAFPEERKFKGHIGYGLLRSTVFRRFRLPPPTVTPGKKA